MVAKAKNADIITIACLQALRLLWAIYIRRGVIERLEELIDWCIVRVESTNVIKSTC